LSPEAVLPCIQQQLQERMHIRASGLQNSFRTAVGRKGTRSARALEYDFETCGTASHGTFRSVVRQAYAARNHPVKRTSLRRVHVHEGIARSRVVLGRQFAGHQSNVAAQLQ
jgi:hypothetical protein